MNTFQNVSVVKQGLVKMLSHCYKMLIYPHIQWQTKLGFVWTLQQDTVWQQVHYCFCRLVQWLARGICSA